MNRNCLFNKVLSLLLCAILLIGYLPVSALPAAAATNDEWESDKDILETTTSEPETTAPETEPETTVPETEPETTAPEVGPAPVGGEADFDTIVTTNANGDSSYTKTFTTANGWITEYSAIQTGGSTVMNPQFPVIGADNTHKAVCLNGKTTAPGKITSPTLSGGISKLTINYTKMFTDTKLSATITVTDVATGATYTHTVAKEAEKDDKYTVWTDEWTLDTPVTGDFTIVIVNDCPSNSTSNKDRMTILDLVWEGANAEPVIPETTVPETEPETTVPETEPETTVPETEPETTVPETEPETTAPEAPEAGLEVGKTYKWAIDQGNKGVTIYFAGTMSGYYGATTENIDNAVDVVLEEANGGYYVSFTNASGAKKYVNVVVNGTYRNFTIADSAATVYTYSAEHNTLLTNVNGTTCYIGTYSNYTTFSVSSIDKIGTSFPSYFVAVESAEPETTVPETEPETTVPETEPETTVPETEPETTAPEAPETGVEAGKTYKWAIDQGNKGVTIYFAGTMSGYYGATTENIDNAVDVVLEAANGGYYVSFTNPDGAKKYVNVVVSGTHRNFTIADSAATVYTYSAEHNTLLTDVNGTTCYIGTYSNYTTFSVSPIDKIGTSFPSYFVAVESPEPETTVPETEPETTVPETEPETEPPTEAPGAESNPIFLFEQENTVTNIGTMYYQGYFAGQTVTVFGEGDFSVIFEGETIPASEGMVEFKCPAVMGRPMPNVFAIVGDGEFTVKAVYPVGTMQNPDVAYSYNYATIEAGNNQGYFYTYTAEYTGNLIVEISAETGWTYVINNLTTYNYGDMQWSDSDPVVNPAVVAVTEGDEIQIIVNTYDPADMWNNPAGNIEVMLSYEEGTCEAYPVWLVETENMVTNVGTTYYGCYFSGTAMTVSGEGDFSVIYNGETLPAEDGCVCTLVSSPYPRMPITFAIVGDGDYTITFAYPAGTQMNPATAVLGNNACAIEAGNDQGYYFTYTAEQTGNLIFELSAETGWIYVINNMTTYQYGDMQWSDSDPVVNPAVIAVTEGDLIEIMVNTYDPENMWSNPAGEITIKLSYEVEEILNGWILEGDKWAYYVDGEKLTNDWAMDSAGWYYMGADGYAVKNAWTKDSSGWYYMDETGRAVRNTWVMNEGGWMYIGGNKHPVVNGWAQDSAGWYYMGADGYAVKNAWTEDSTGLYYMDETGRAVKNTWVENKGGWMYIGGDKHPVMNGWAQDRAGWYYMGADGYAVKNTWALNEGGWMFIGDDKHPVKNDWAEDSHGWYYMGADGYAIKNAWTEDSTGLYYMDETGRAVKNTWVKNTNGWMYIGSNKHPVTNAWAKDSAGWYYMGADGYAVKNAWTKDSSGWYYMDETGRAVKNGWAEDSQGRLYMGADGHAVKNAWVTVGGNKYYANASGYIVTGRQTIGGKVYTFNANGVLVG